MHVGAKEARLTPKEFALLVYLVRHPNRVVPHKTILLAIWAILMRKLPIGVHRSDINV